MIKIQAEKIIVRGEKWVKIIDIKARNYDNLPSEYTKAGPHVYMHNHFEDGSLLSEMGEYLLRKNHQYPEREFNKNLEHIRAAGKRLQEINSRLKKENAGWTGALEVII